MSNIVCAYCHIKGHHIKYCEELAEKNRRAAMKQQSSFVRPTNTVPLRPTIAAVSKPVCKPNAFADLYSSSEEEEEEEEGEIVEEDRVERIQAQAAANPYLFRPISPESSDADSETKWRRSGIKGVVIPIIETATRKDTSGGEDSDCSGSYEMSPEMQKKLEELMVYSRKYAGMSWADIENLSEDE